MSVTVTVSKALIKEFPEVSYQLFNLSSQEEEQEFVLVYTAKGYYRELTDLLDLYQIPYQIYSSRNLSLLHVLIFEEDGLALDLKQQLEAWGFGYVEIAHDYYSFRHRKGKKVSLALIDNQTLHLLSLWIQLQLLLQLLAVPLILLAAFVEKHKLTIWWLIKHPTVLYKPFPASGLREAIERRLHIALSFSSKR